MSREEKEAADTAVRQLLQVETKLGIVAGLALVAKKQQELQCEDDDASTTASASTLSPNDKRESSRKPQRKQLRNGSAHTGGADAVGELDENNSPAVSGGAHHLGASKKYSVHDQRDVIRKLHEQNQILKQELSIEYRDAKTLLGHEKRQRLEYLHKMVATFVKKIDLVRKNSARIDELLVKKTQELELVRQQQQHAESGGTSSNVSSSALGKSTHETSSTGTTADGGAIAAATESSAASMRRVRALENRLELSLVKKNEMDSINKHLRAQIEKVRKDRVVFDGIYKKLEKEMSDYRQRHELSVEELKKAVDAKHQVNLEMQTIQTQAEQEQRNYEQQFQELKALIETSMRETARLGGVGPTSPLTLVSPSFAAGGKFGHSTDSDEPSPLQLGVTDTRHANESALNRVSVLSTWKIGYDRALATTNEGIVAKYDKALAGIKQMTGIKDITKIADEIVHRDEANFKRFKRVEELHQEQVLLQAQVDELSAQIETFKAQEGLATSATQKQQYRDLEQTHRKALETSKGFDNDYEDTTTTLTRIKSSVHSIHSMLAHANCARNVDKFSEGSAHLALGSHSARDVTDANVLEYLQAIETFATSLMKETHETAANLVVHPSGSAFPDDSVAPGAASSPLSGLQPSRGSSSQALPSHEAVAATSSSPIGHGPPTLPSDPSQKLRVQVPSFGGVNGVIIVPANSPFDNDHVAEGSGSSKKPVQSPMKALQQQQQMLQRRKSSVRFDVAARKSLSQVQFVAALTAAVSANNDQPLASAGSAMHGGTGSSESHDARSAPSGTGAGSTDQVSRATLEEDEEERALTYEELRQYAAKNVVKKKSDEVVSAVSHGQHEQ